MFKRTSNRWMAHIRFLLPAAALAIGASSGEPIPRGRDSGKRIALGQGRNYGDAD